MGPCDGFSHEIIGGAINSYGMLADVPALPLVLIERVDRDGPDR
jgi:hypothetical protein